MGNKKRNEMDIFRRILAAKQNDGLNKEQRVAKLMANPNSIKNLERGMARLKAAQEEEKKRNN